MSRLYRLLTLTVLLAPLAAGLACSAASTASRSASPPEADPFAGLGQEGLQAEMERRFPTGAPISAAEAELKELGFECDNVPQEDGRRILFGRRSVSRDFWTGWVYIVKLEHDGERVQDVSASGYGTGP